MKRELKLVFLLALVSGICTFSNKWVSTANATYVGGVILQDTVWTLTDSPYVVFKDVVVSQNAVLSVESGAEVRFGGFSSLIVYGTLIANGTRDNPITFTSNRVQPEAGDWGTIGLYGGHSRTSELEFCQIEFATEGLSVENSSVKLTHSTVSHSLGNGVSIMNAEIEISNSDVSNNLQTGIYASGENQATVRNNTLRSNADGIIIGGSNVTGLDISQNTVTSNTHSGLQLTADSHSGIVILFNVLSSNNIGLQVSSQASTIVTNNSISHNNIGVSYLGTSDHEIHFCDVYSNEIGLTSQSDAFVDATYNYWGHESGPYHVSLNPRGLGDSVESNGAKVDFIFFLSAPIHYVNERPEAKLLADKTLVRPNQTVTFFATDSTDDKRVSQHFFDFGDGKNSGWTTLSIFVHQYSLSGVYNATLVVRDDFGVNSTNESKIAVSVQNVTPLKVHLTSNQYDVSYGAAVSITVHVTNGTAPTESASVTVFSIKGGTFTSSTGTTNTTGHFETVFTAPDVTQVTNVRITASASKTGYADGSDHKYLTILPPLMVDLAAESVKSEETGKVYVNVLYNGHPVAGAAVNVDSSGGGDFSYTTSVTDVNGDVEFTFVAPQTLTVLNVTITATAAKSGYINGSGTAQLQIIPKTLNVIVDADSSTIVSEATAEITIHVTYGSNPISNATVSISADDGSFNSVNGTTDTKGNCAFAFTAPQAATPLNITVTAAAEKVGYVNSGGQIQVAVYPGILNIQVAANSASVESETQATITVHATCNSKPVAAVLVAVSSDDGTIYPESAVTDVNGDVEFTFVAPQTLTVLNVTITATAAKSGYIDAETQTEMNVNPVSSEPASEGFPLISLLMVAIPIAVLVVVLLLIKLNIINITTEED